MAFSNFTTANNSIICNIHILLNINEVPRKLRKKGFHTFDLELIFVRVVWKGSILIHRRQYCQVVYISDNDINISETWIFVQFSWMDGILKVHLKVSKPHAKEGKGGHLWQQSIQLYWFIAIQYSHPQFS